MAEAAKDDEVPSIPKAGDSTKEPKPSDSDTTKKADPSSENDDKNEKVVANVAERLRFFFSDANVRQDRFLRREINNNPSGHVSIVTLLRFNSIKAHTTDPAVVAKAARHESLEGKLKLTEDEKNVYRTDPWTDEKLDDNVRFSIYVKNLPVEGNRYKVTMNDIRSLFEEYGRVALVKMRFGPPPGSADENDERYLSPRKRRSNFPRGSCFVEFETEEELAKAAADLCAQVDEEEVEKSDDKKAGKEGAIAMDVGEAEPKKENEEAAREEDHTEQKEKEGAEAEKQQENKQGGGNAIEVDANEPKKEEEEEEQAVAEKEEKPQPKKKLKLQGNVLEIVTMKSWLDKKKKEEGDKGGKATDAVDKEDALSRKRSRDEKQEKVEKEVEYKEFKLDWKAGCVISLKGLPEDCDREALRSALTSYLSVSEDEFKTMGIYVDYSRGQTHGAIRFDEPTDRVKDVHTKLAEGEMKIADKKVESATILEGDEEEKYWKDFIEFKNKQKKHRAEQQAAKKRKGGRFRGDGRGRT